ncbi:hypothetical protein P9112_007809 [Eukaryota sp. TZLM1-RC]
MQSSAKVIRIWSYEFGRMITMITIIVFGLYSSYHYCYNYHLLFGILFLFVQFIVSTSYHASRDVCPLLERYVHVQLRMRIVTLCISNPFALPPKGSLW